MEEQYFARLGVMREKLWALARAKSQLQPYGGHTSDRRRLDPKGGG